MRSLSENKIAMVLVAMVIIFSTSWAGTIPDAGTILREIERSTGKQEMAPAPLTIIDHPPASAPLPEKAGETVLVISFRIKATLFSEDTLRSLLKDYVGRALTLAELQEAARKIGDYYTQHDYLAHAYLPPQTVHDGVVEIVVVESRLSQVKIDPSSTTRLNYSLATGLIQFRAEVGQLLHPSKLSESMEIFNEIPGVRATSTLAPGLVESESVAILKIEDGPLLGGMFTLDKGGSHTTGAKRALLTTAINDYFGQGDQFSVVGLKSSGSSYIRLGATMPAGISGLMLGTNGSVLEYKVGGALTPLDLHGHAWTMGVNAGYPIKRSSNFSLTANATFDHKRMVDFGNEVMLGDKQIEVFTFGLSAMIKDGWLGDATNRLGITFNAGRLDLSRQKEKFKADQSTARTNGVFTKLAFTAAREQLLWEKIILVDNFRAQVARPNLDGSEQFSLGGQDGIRAYPVSEAAGDAGWINSLELRWQKMDQLQLFGFYDIGRIHQHNHLWDGWQSVPGQPNGYLLHGTGIGMMWSPFSYLQVKATLARTIDDNPGHDVAGNDSDGTQDKMRSWIQAVINF
ncbi:conserved hypothetical protein [Gammaproteobacteria bacterium]